MKKEDTTIYEAYQKNGKVIEKHLIKVRDHDKIIVGMYADHDNQATPESIRKVWRDVEKDHIHYVEAIINNRVAARKNMKNNQIVTNIPEDILQQWRRQLVVEQL